MIYTVDTPAAALHVERTGEGPAIVLIPGGGGDAAMYKALTDELARKYTVIAYDRRGNSRSSLRPGAFGVGALSEGRYYSRPARQLSTELGVPCLEFPGGHLGYQGEAAEFARRLQEFFDA